MVEEESVTPNKAFAAERKKPRPLKSSVIVLFENN